MPEPIVWAFSARRMLGRSNYYLGYLQQVVAILLVFKCLNGIYKPIFLLRNQNTHQVIWNVIFGIGECVKLKYNSVKKSFPCGAEDSLFLWAGVCLDALT
jgi:hypothetical protein